MLYKLKITIKPFSTICLKLLPNLPKSPISTIILIQRQNEGGTGVTGWAMVPQYKEKKIISKKKNVKFCFNLSHHLAPLQKKKKAIFLDFLVMSNKIFWPNS
jgi:hypothetical protein